MTIAAATPAMLPVPTVAASAVHSAWNGEIAALSLLCPITCFLNKLPMVCLTQKPRWLTWKNLVSTVIRMPVPSSSTSPSLTQTKPLMSSLIWVSRSKNWSIVASPPVNKNKKAALRRCGTKTQTGEKSRNRIAHSVLLPERLNAGCAFAPSASAYHSRLLQNVIRARSRPAGS